MKIPEMQQDPLLEWSTKLTIAMALMAAGLKFKHSYLVKHKQMLGVLVIGAMLLMFGISSLVSRYLLNLDWPATILIGAIITPTDQVISSSMISGKFSDKLLNNNIKGSLYFESGINDGLAFPLVAIGWMLVQKGEMNWLHLLVQKGEMNWLHWQERTVLYENVLAALFLPVIGYS